MSPQLKQKKDRKMKPKYHDFGFKTILKEVPRTEEIDLSHSLTSGYFVRLHIRSRSVLVIRRRSRPDEHLAHKSGGGLDLELGSDP